MPLHKSDEPAPPANGNRPSSTTPLATADLTASWDALRGVFPTCSGCGARVLHASVLVCFHCKQRTPIRAAALEAARAGYRVGPLCKPDPNNPRAILGPHGKDPVGRLVPHGVNSFTTDIATINRWWSYEQWNIGVAVPGPMFVLDVDGPDRLPHPGRGLQGLAELEAKHWLVPPTFTQISGSGGLQLFFQRPHGKLTKTKLKPYGLDIKDNGYVVWAPSIHPDSGEAYVRCDHPVATPPQWLVDLITVAPRPVATPRPFRMTFSGPSIADNYCASAKWTDILTPKGWECKSGDGNADGSRWLHPTTTSSCSATIKNDCLFVYSPNTPFDVTEDGNPKGYTKFRAYAVLNFGGDMSAAARELELAAKAVVK
jgi:Bifunctional DNA primase/polymerase, N-terminal